MIEDLTAAQLADAIGLLTYDEAAARLDVSPSTIRTWVERYPDRLQRVTWDGRGYVLERDVLACERDRRRSGRRRLT